MSKRCLAIACGALALVVGWPGDASACNEGPALLVARAVALTDPSLEDRQGLDQLMRDNPGYFAEDGSAIACMKRLGIALTQKGVADANRSPSARERWGGAMPPGLQHVPEQVDRSMNHQAGGLYFVGENLLWLARVLPAAAGGDYSAYQRHEAFGRRMLYQNAMLQKQLCQINPWQCQFNEMNRANRRAEMEMLQRMIYHMALSLRRQ